MGEVGDVYFRSIDVSGIMSNGLSLAIQPIIDGVLQTEQLFSLAGSGEWQCQAFLAIRGTRIAATVRTLSRAGDVELHQIACGYVPIRRTP
jgi:hypothetical protein